jgi:hypothetical protein
MPNIKLSKKFSLDSSDWLRGLGIAVATPVLIAVQRVIDAGKMDFSWKSLLMAGIGGGVAYILKNWLFEPAKTVVTSDTNTKAENVAEKVKEVL